MRPHFSGGACIQAISPPLRYTASCSSTYSLAKVSYFTAYFRGRVTNICLQRISSSWSLSFNMAEYKSASSEGQRQAMLEKQRVKMMNDFEQQRAKIAKVYLLFDAVLSLHFI